MSVNMLLLMNNSFPTHSFLFLISLLLMLHYGCLHCLFLLLCPVIESKVINPLARVSYLLFGFMLSQYVLAFSSATVLCLVSMCLCFQVPPPKDNFIIASSPSFPSYLLSLYLLLLSLSQIIIP